MYYWLHPNPDPPWDQKELPGTLIFHFCTQQRRSSTLIPALTSESWNSLWFNWLRSIVSTFKSIAVSPDLRKARGKKEGCMHQGMLSFLESAYWSYTWCQGQVKEGHQIPPHQIPQGVFANNSRELGKNDKDRKWNQELICLVL